MKTGDLLFWYPAENKPWPSAGNMCFYCPACKEEHPYQLGHGLNWEFNGNFEKPSFSPSLLIKSGYRKSFPDGHVICHLFVRDGMIEYCSDCPHEYAGMIIPMIPWDEETNYWKGAIELE